MEKLHFLLFVSVASFITVYAFVFVDAIVRFCRSKFSRRKSVLRSLLYPKAKRNMKVV
jgi:hypothetical protein